MDNSQLVQVASPKQKIYVRLYMFALLIFEFLSLLLFCNGIASFYERTVNVTTAVELLFSILNMGDAYYKGIFATITGVWYIITFVLIIKHIIKTIGMIKRSCVKKELRIDPVASPITDISEYAFNVFINIFSFMMFCELIKEYTLSITAKTFIILSICIFMFTRVLLMMLNKYTQKSIFINIGYMLILFFAATLVILNVIAPAFNDFLTDTKLLFRELELSNNFADEICGMIQSFLSIIIIFTTIKVISVANQAPLCKGTYAINSKSKAVLYLCITMAIIPVFGYVFAGKYITIKAIVSIILPYLPLILATVGLLLYGYFSKEDDMNIEPQASPEGPIESVSKEEESTAESTAESTVDSSTESVAATTEANDGATVEQIEPIENHNE